MATVTHRWGLCLFDRDHRWDLIYSVMFRTVQKPIGTKAKNKGLSYSVSKGLQPVIYLSKTFYWP